eukprot:gb/GFBE01043985.1/.p1 GENE.gb/GFBE01043985.1/~~gb/GFBE01043985.1/.p1  ORF type:complete len:184 (+),score=30.29 gb/GFBE01043985.1/:1-552(+)
MGCALGSKPDLWPPGHGLDSDPGGEIPGVNPGGGSCTCQYPPVDKVKLHRGDKAFWYNLDGFTAETLAKRKPEGEQQFEEGLQRFNAVKDRLDEAVTLLKDRYTDRALARRELELAQSGLAWEHFSKCRPLGKKYGLYLPCHENFTAAMRRYRSLMEAPKMCRRSFPSSTACLDTSDWRRSRQ